MIPSGNNSEKVPRLIFYALAVFTAFFMLVAVLMAAVPPVSRDALTHHLAVPKRYLTQGRMLELPDIVASYFPMNLDLLYLIPLAWGNDIIPKYIHMAFGLLTALLIGGYLNRRLNRIYGIMGTLLFLSLPIIIQLSITVYVDLGLIFFSTAALLSLLKWQQDGWRRRHLVFAALFCGLAMGTKYNGLVVFLLLSLMVPVIAGRRTTPLTNSAERKREWFFVIRSSLLFGALALLLFSPWLLRNLVWTGNPLFPLYDSVFNPQNPYIETRLNPFDIRRFVYGESLWQTLLVPLRIFFQGQDDVPALFDGRLNPFLFPLAIIGFFSFKRDARRLVFEKAVWGGFALLFILIVFFTRDMRIRYIAPAIPPLVILSVFGVKNLFGVVDGMVNRSMRRLLCVATAMVVFVAIVLNTNYLLHKWQVTRPIEYISGKVDRSTYITRRSPEFTVVQYANQRLADGDRVLCLFLGNRRYYFEVGTIFQEWPKFKGYIESAPDAQALTDALINRGISHVMTEIESLHHWSHRDLSQEDLKITQQWFGEYLDELLVSNGYGLFRLRLNPLEEPQIPLNR